ncbi:selenide, water dikinase SelD [Sulfuriroseicoccus oceanibius]|uniref:Selenide, water dikinase n=1 Tax=Sulfuriroseicoccus oceanibius TaxID=2707525 RepID=A0A6B3L7C9_9BACT|nr:selenide, water dikinase SelD [Sulfuriroseicoccus oceanibius]
MRGLNQHHDPAVIVGSATSDDAAVYQMTPDTALVQTLDFFTPIVDDPYLFGQIAATNSLSDVYAMGGKPITAMNIMGVPTDQLTLEQINLILKGGADKVVEAECAMVGGHTVQNPEPLYGLSVTGVVHPDRMMSNEGAKPGDVLVLSKPIGTGIISTAIKRGIATGAMIDASVDVMRTLNTPGATIAGEGLCQAATDVTGFGLLGHLANICKSSQVSAQLNTADIPLVDPDVLELIQQGCVPGGSKKNREMAEPMTRIEAGVEDHFMTLVTDAQTSGGLLLCVPPAHVDRVLEILREENALCAAIVGEVLPAEADGTRVVLA